jgi:SAM-dependent methyltransferase
MRRHDTHVMISPMDKKIELRFANVGRSKTFQNIVAHFGLRTKKVLDIGCSYGEFVAHFGPGSVGISIEQEEVLYGVGRGLDIRYGNIESDDFALDEQFDVIFANNIFEHLYSPHAFLIKAKRYLRPGGVLILGVPCVPKFVSLMRIGKFRGSLASGHINFFTRTTLINTVARGGWKIAGVRGFHFAHPFVDHLLDPIYPHFYVAAQPDPDFVYPEKRLREIAGYGFTKE